jgi:hypothetical protein
MSKKYLKNKELGNRAIPYNDVMLIFTGSGVFKGIF